MTVGLLGTIPTYLIIPISAFLFKGIVFVVVIHVALKKGRFMGNHNQRDSENKPKQKSPNKNSPPQSGLDIPRKSWFDHAACRGKTELMFPKQHKDITYIAQARTICKSCPVRAECLEYALEFPPADMHGVWAGLTSRQLAQEQRKRKIKPTRPTLAQMWGEQ